MRHPTRKIHPGIRSFTLWRAKVFIFTVSAVAFSYAITHGSSAAGLSDETADVTAQQDFSKFLHSSPQHTRMPCLVCHVRKDNSAAISFPSHIPCSSCHVQQFADNQSPICTICHTATGMKRFPGLRSFKATFNHARHTSQTNCATCHRPASGGAALSVPSGANAHLTCFACHGPKSDVGGRNIGSCSECHQPGSPVRNTATAKAFSVNFDHGEHTRRNMSCSACHTVRPGSSRGRQVSAPLASMHFAPSGTLSCASCHNNKKAFGGTDFKDCKQCHERNSFRFRR